MVRVSGWRRMWGVVLFCGVTATASLAQVTFTTLVSFDGTNGEWPNLMTLTQGSDGKFYGTTLFGGNICASCGTVFKVSSAGTLTTLYSFCSQSNCADGDSPVGTLIQAASKDFYGVTLGGGANGGGTVFKITSAGELITIYSFCTLTNCADGDELFAGLVQDGNGNFYGTTIFEITPGGKLMTLFTFGPVDGDLPTGGLLQATNGTFYGTTLRGGADGDGTVFSLSTGLGPFAKTQPTSALQGAAIGIFGQGFTSSTVVQFGGVQATNVKLSGTTFLFATVPAGALTGSVTVTTGATTLTSNQIFRVTPQVVSFDPPSGSVGTQITITGTGFTQTNGVGFGDNVPAEFTVNSDTQVTATVPAGAKTGPVGVVTKGGTGISAAMFTVN
jgi:uncharacterized repeat protein (TIGR03803 family)